MNAIIFFQIENNPLLDVSYRNKYIQLPYLDMLESMFLCEDRGKQLCMILKRTIPLFGNVKSLSSPGYAGNPSLHMIRIECAVAYEIIMLSSIFLVKGYKH